MRASKKNTTRDTVVLVAALVVLAGVFFTAYQLLRPKGETGAKTIGFAVIVGEETVKEVEIHTDAEFLRQALEDEGLIDGEDSAYGMWVTSVAGREADSKKEEWWALYKNGEFSMTGVDDTVVEDGDSVEYILAVGYN